MAAFSYLSWALGEVVVSRVSLFVVAVVAAGCGSPRSSYVSAHDMATGNADGGPPPELAIAPKTANIGFGQTLQLTSNRPVTWSVSESGGGQIDANGLYTAPFVPADYHVRAVTTTGGTVETDVATVTVADHALTLVAGTYGGIGDGDGIGAAARFSNAQGMAYDGSRYLYLADAGAIRRVDTTTGEVTTIAGQARWWTGNVDGVGPAAKLSIAWSLALDGKGGLYVSDVNNCTIRKVDLATHAVTTVAGAAGSPGFTNAVGTAAQFAGPMGLAFDSANDKLYISDANNAAIRSFDPATGQVTTLLSTDVQRPDGLAYDGNGTLYVADANGYQILGFDLASQAVTRLAGAARGYCDGIGAYAHFDNPGQLALEGGALYVADTLAIRQVDLTSHQVTSLPVRGGQARFLSGVLGDGQGRIYVADQTNFALSRLTLATGATSVVAGPDGDGYGNVDAVGAAARFSDPGSLVYDPSGVLYVSDVTNSELRQVDLASAAVSTVVGSAWKRVVADGVGRNARLGFPTALASDHAGTLYVVEPDTALVRKWDIASDTLTTLAGTWGAVGSRDGVGGAALFSYPVAACVDGGALYVVDQGNATIRKITLATGVVETVAGMVEQPGAGDGVGAAARFNAPSGIACDGAGNVYVADQQNYAIRRIALASGTVDTVAGALGAMGQVDMPGKAARFQAPTDMTFANGFLYVVDFGSADLHVRKIALGSWNVQTVATSTLSGQQFYGITVDGSGTVYVSNKQPYNSTVQKVAGDGTLSLVAGGPGQLRSLDGVGAAAAFYAAAGLAFDGSGGLYVAEPSSQLIRRIDLATATVTTALGVSGLAGNSTGVGAAAVLASPQGIIDVAGQLYFGDSVDGTIDWVTMPGATVSVLAGAALGTPGKELDGLGSAAQLLPAGMVYDGKGTAYMTGDGTIRSVQLASGQVDTLAGTDAVIGTADGTKSAASFHWPKGIARDDDGNLYVSDTFNHTIRKVVLASGEVTTFAGAATMFGAVDGVGDAARFFYPLDIVYDGKGNLYVADSENGAIRRIEIATRAVSTYVGALGQKGLQPGALPARLNAPRGLALLPDGGLAITDEQAVLIVH
jgi:sugar lactone lactonase YvrE